MPSAMEILSEEGFNDKTSPIVSDISIRYTRLSRCCTARESSTG